MDYRFDANAPRPMGQTNQHATPDAQRSAMMKTLLGSMQQGGGSEGYRTTGAAAANSLADIIRNVGMMQGKG